MICLKDYFEVSPDYVPYKETFEQKLENEGYDRLLYTYCSENNTYYVYGSSDNDNEKTCTVKKGVIVGHTNTTNVFEDETIRSVNVLPGVQYLEGAVGYNDITIPDTVISASIHGDEENDSIVEMK